MKLLVATSKGLIIYRKTKQGWIVDQSHFLGFPVTVAYVDERTNTWWAGVSHRHWGQKLHRSFDEGKTWEQITTPKYPASAVINSGKPASLKMIWSMAHAGHDKPDELYLGTEPGGLFHSKDGGTTFQLVESLWDHPSREKQWFGAGRDHPFIHSIVVDPRDSKHVYIAVSCAGVFETKDGSQTWAPQNKGLVAAYLPNPSVEVGHDPHLLLACHSQPEVLWQQNHCGIFRSSNGGAYWDDVTGQGGFPNYGFALAIDHQDANRAWVIPATSDEIRTAVDLALCVCRTEDGGKNWEALRNGLPQENCFDIVFRHALDIYQNNLAFGTTNGNLYLSENFGDDWQCLSNHLARIECIKFVIN